VEHPPDTTQCGPWGAGSRNDDIRILFVSYKRSERLEVGNCAPINGIGERSNASAGLPNGGRCFLEPVDALQSLPMTAFDAAVYDVASLPHSKLPAMLLDESDRPSLRPLHRHSVVGVMSLEPSSYFSLASEGCRKQRNVALDLRPSLSSSVPLPYFSWHLHPLNLPLASAGQRHKVTFPKDKVPLTRAPALLPRAAGG
jgi:hypothetical protein